MRKAIQDEFTDRPISRQRKYQLRKQRDKRCTECGVPAVVGSRCLKHLVKARERQRTKRGLKRRYYSTLSYRLEEEQKKKATALPVIMFFLLLWCYSTSAQPVTLNGTNGIGIDIAGTRLMDANGNHYIYSNGTLWLTGPLSETNHPSSGQYFDNVADVGTNQTADKTWTSELTLRADGLTTRHGTEFALDVGYETNPFKWCSSLWVELDQGVAWSPEFAGSMDLTVEYAFPLYKDLLYFNTGWSGGVLYAAHGPPIYRTGPEFNLQWFTFDHAFVFAGLNFDVFTKREPMDIRPSIGIGMTW